MKSESLNQTMQGEVVIYQSQDGDTKIDVHFVDETVWLTQAQLCELYHSSKSNISEHIKNIFIEGELEKEAVVRKFRTTASDGKKYAVSYYNLDMIISLGYRIKSSIATQFRRWASARLKEYLIKGFTVTNLRYMRKFYQTFPIRHALRDELYPSQLWNPILKLEESLL